MPAFAAPLDLPGTAGFTRRRGTVAPFTGADAGDDRMSAVVDLNSDCSFGVGGQYDSRRTREKAR